MIERPRELEPVERDPILRDVPETIRTARLELSVPRPGDGGACAEAVRSSLQQLKAWLPWAHDQYSDADAELWCRRARGDWHLRKELCYVVRLKGEPTRVLGTCSTHEVDWHAGATDVGYWLRTDATGEGYATEATRGLVACLFEEVGLRRVTVTCNDLNARSAAVAERAGFALETTRRGKDLRGGECWERLYVRVP